MVTDPFTEDLIMLERFFKFREHGTTLGTETIAGITTFLAMAYIIFVNPVILGATGMDKTALITVTCLATALATVLTGLFANGFPVKRRF